jgi:hypothetical protein
MEIDSWESRSQMTTASQEKIEINKKINEILLPLLSDKAHLARVVTLDGSDFHTSRQWIKLGILPSNIIVPAPFLSSHEQKMTEELKSINLTKEFVFDTLGKLAPNSINCIFLDYLSTFNGNDVTVPRLDLEVLFSRKLLCDFPTFPDALLVITVSMRDGRDDKRREERFAKVWGTVAKIAAKYDYLTIPTMTKCYAPAMFVCAFIVRQTFRPSLEIITIKEEEKDEQEQQQEQPEEKEEKFIQHLEKFSKKRSRSPDVGNNVFVSSLTSVKRCVKSRIENGKIVTYELKVDDNGPFQDIEACLQEVLLKKPNVWHKRTVFLSTKNVDAFLEMMKIARDKSTHKSYTKTVRSDDFQLLAFCRRKLDIMCDDSMTHIFDESKSSRKNIILIKRDENDKRWLFKLETVRFTE